MYSVRAPWLLIFRPRLRESHETFLSPGNCILITPVFAISSLHTLPLFLPQHRAAISIFAWWPSKYISQEFAWNFKKLSARIKWRVPIWKQQNFILPFFLIYVRTFASGYPFCIQLQWTRIFSREIWHFRFLWAKCIRYLGEHTFAARWNMFENAVRVRGRRPEG